MKWIIGLGNPGKRYAATRHNVGFDVLDRFARMRGFDEYRKKFASLMAEKPPAPPDGEKVFLLKPQTYMNRSGGAVREALDYFGAGPEDLLVVHDDIDLPLGRLRYRSSGSSGGHRGVESILNALGTDRFARLKIGIGREVGRDAADYVLAPVATDDREPMARAVARAAESLDVWLLEGLERAALLYNGKEPEG